MTFDLSDVSTPDHLNDVRAIAAEVVEENYGEPQTTRMSRMAQWIVACLRRNMKVAHGDNRSAYDGGVGTVWRAAALIELGNYDRELTAREARQLATALLEAADDADALLRDDG